MLASIVDLSFMVDRLILKTVVSHCLARELNAEETSLILHFLVGFRREFFFIFRRDNFKK